MSSAFNGYVEKCKFLISANADVNARDSGYDRTPMLHCVICFELFYSSLAVLSSALLTEAILL
jgi:hypothetical protein